MSMTPLKWALMNVRPAKTLNRRLHRPKGKSCRFSSARFVRAFVAYFLSFNLSLSFTLSNKSKREHLKSTIVIVKLLSTRRNKHSKSLHLGAIERFNLTPRCFLAAEWFLRATK